MLASLEQTFFYWKTLYDFTFEHDYHIFQMMDNEVWLISPKRGGYCVRFLRYDIDWGNWITRDLEQVALRKKEIEKTLKRKITLINVYISTYEPVDDWEFRLNSSDANMETILISREQQREQSETLYKKLNLPFPNFYELENINEDSVDELKTKIKENFEENKKKEKEIFSFGKPIFTYTVIIINTLLFFLLEANGGSENTETLIQFGAKYNPLIVEGEWWRLVIPMFLHIGFLHFFMNTLALYYLGSLVERIYGSFRFFIIYIVAGIIGVISSFAFNIGISAGASGAIYGCFGALLYFGVVQPKLFFRTMGSNLLFVLGLNLLLTFMVPMIDNSAHIGGLTAGFLASSVVHLPNHKVKKSQLAGFTLFLIILFMLIQYGFSSEKNNQNPEAVVQLASYYIENDNYLKAEQVLNNIFQKQSEQNLPAEAYFLKAYLEINEQEYEQAVEHLGIAISKRKDFHEAYYNLALVHVKLKQIEKARVYIERAIQYQPKNEQYQTLYKELLGYH